MQMSFHINEKEVILFREWHPRNWTELGWSLLGIVLLACIYEGLKSYRDHLFINTTRSRKSNGRKSRLSLLFSRIHFLQTVIHVLQLVIGYSLMLIVMTYNSYLLLAVLVGAAIGYWLFSWEKSSGNDIDCCL